ncbi:MAG: ferredoxin--NADP reductase [Ignavibacteriales bacterium]|nr:ferredoxin--NADP reductase [Ignavibacteriales bacterium]MCF8304970.1 ferredoxin--NADP reductase [Ignavibacteriales bacterium]MCF8314659.1 ferredoxin--NADP reductase [Ignavibacteriales bacterium]MCF8436304.1 ferredoxin--NADP reductase [Ignavibacteriales bacterium]
MSDYVTLKILSIQKESHDTIKILLQPENGEILNFIPGQFITILFKDHLDEFRRGYSIFTSPSDLPIIGIAVKKFREGVTSRFLENIRIGDLLTAHRPMGNFFLRPLPETKRDLYFFGAGSGITPLFSMIKSTLEDEPLSNATLIYGNKNEESVMLITDIDELKNKYGGRFKVSHRFSRGKTENKSEIGRIDRNFVLDLLKREKPGQNSEFFLCGPEGMMLSVIEALSEFGIKGSRIHKEYYYVTVLDETVQIEKKSREVSIIFRGKEYKIIVEPGESVLEKAIESGIDLPNSCQYGSCGTCRAKLISGSMQLIGQSALSDEDKNAGFTLTCVGFPASDNVVILYDDEFA